MTISDAEYLRGLYSNILNDVAEQYPTDRREVDRDRLRLHRAFDHRGIRLFTIDLPAMGKHIDRCLAEGRLLPCTLAFSRSSHRKGLTPRLFRELFRRVFEDTGLLRADPDIQAVKFLRQLYYAGKKLKMPCSDSVTYQTVAEFYQIDAEVRLGDLPWKDDHFDASQAKNLSLGDLTFEDEISSHVSDQLVEDCLYTIQDLADRVATSMGQYDPNEWAPKHGPGAVADQKRGENKYLFPHWPSKLDHVYPMAEFAFANFGLWADAVSEPDVAYGLDPIEPPSRLIAVPKSQKGPRLIAAEPIAHQFCQQSILRFLTGRRGRAGLAGVISFNDQEPSRQAALEASRTGESWTIDLSSASDRMSCYVVERIFRRNIPLLEALHATRTRRISNTLDKKSPEVYDLRKFSTQGAAVTFPLQSYVYAIVALGVYFTVRDINFRTRAWPEHMKATGVRVFGDDIIVPDDCGATTVAVLERLGFKVNRDKTYGVGRFRESCGMDAFMGHDVTPAYATQPPQQARPESMISAVTQCNNFFKKGYNHAADWIKSTCTRIPLLRGLPSAPVDSGILAYPTWSSTVHPRRRRWNAGLQRMEYFYPRPLARTRTKHTQGSTGFLRFFLEGPGPEFFWSSAINQQPTTVLRGGWGPLPA